MTETLRSNTFILDKVIVGIGTAPSALRRRSYRRVSDRRLTSEDVVSLAAHHGVASSVVWACVRGSQGEQVTRASTLEVDSPRMCLVHLVGNQPTLRLVIGQLLSSGTPEGVLVAGDLLGGDHMAPFSPGIHLQIYTWEDTKIGGRPVYQAVSEWLRERGVWWVSVTRSAAGYTKPTRSPGRRWRLPIEPVPLVVDVIDVADRLKPYLNELAEWLGDDAMIVQQHVGVAGLPPRG